MPGLAYLDSSAIVKLLIAEPESDALRAELRARPHRVSSALARVEVTLAATRWPPVPPPERLAILFAGLALVPIDEPVLSAAAGLTYPHLRALDAIHLATCLTLGDDLDVLIAYDQRMLATAATLNIATVQPR